MDQQLADIVGAASRAVASPGDIRGAAAERAPRYELFHAAASICSQKVRAVLFHHDMPFVSHSLSIFLGQTYLPDYVRLRMRGCAEFGGALVAHHSGSTSAAAGGCDGAVVPTLIDWQTGAVIVDSKRICLHLDEQVADADRLRPTGDAAAIDGDLAVVDNLPNYQMLMGRTVSNTESSDTRDGTGAALSERKVALCDRYIAENPGDPTLLAAYTAKRAKELSAAQELFSPEAMRAAYARIEAALDGLDDRLAATATAWLHGDRLTMADLFWGIELLRIKNTGLDHYWQDGRRPHVARFAAATEQVAAILAAVIDWPGALF
ncbi:glutathione S-transferase family protein [Sphingomonas bacterium]|uniref:glutathione S-transferase family protein n=1 Tax=Sphingomonas bacterium TaxID=1895847 RepID=UPI0015751359|nr:glutathione S-transferase C-terminal domain-containing protein [Sphingomonas bacterium]